MRKEPDQWQVLARRIQALMRTNVTSDRAQAFAIFLWQRFRDDRCPQSAGALAFTTLISLVPLTAAILGVLSSFPVFARWQADLTSFVFDNFVPAAGRTVQAYLTEFANNASQATAVGIVVLIISAISLMMSIEDAFNRIWRVATARTAASRFLMYWTALSFGPLLLVTALALSSYLFALPFVAGYEAQLGIKARVLNLLPFLIVWVSLIASYLVIPNRTVRLRDATIGALLAAMLFEAAKRGFAFYLGTLTSYEQVYGALAVVPVFMLWIYLSWLVVLLGASVCAAISAFEYRGLHERLAPGHEFVGLLCVVNHFADAQRAGQGLHSEDLRERERFLTDDLLQRYSVGSASRRHGAAHRVRRLGARAQPRCSHAVRSLRVWSLPPAAHGRTGRNRALPAAHRADRARRSRRGRSAGRARCASERNLPPPPRSAGAAPETSEQS